MMQRIERNGREDENETETGDVEGEEEKEEPEPKTLACGTYFPLRIGWCGKRQQVVPTYWMDEITSSSFLPL